MQRLHPFPIETTTVNLRTGEAVQSTTQGFLMPARSDRCPVCAAPPHDDGTPHNRDSLFYQMQFRGAHGRWPSWADAMSACSPEVQELWRAALKERGVDPDRVPPEPRPHEDDVKIEVPDDAVLPPGTEMTFNRSKTDDDPRPARIVAVVPPGRPVAFAIADQSGAPRPASHRINRRRSNLYVIDIGEPDEEKVRIYVPQRAMKRGLADGADWAARHPERFE